LRRREDLDLRQVRLEVRFAQAGLELRDPRQRCSQRFLDFRSRALGSRVLPGGSTGVVASLCPSRNYAAIPPIIASVCARDD
jgi:hypothetical protein